MDDWLVALNTLIQTVYQSLKGKKTNKLPDNKEGIERNTELVVVDVGDVLDVDPNADQCLVIFVGKIKL